MIFISNVLVLNGGSTFLLRMCRELSLRGQRPVVLVLINKVDLAVQAELSNWADIYYLSDFSSKIYSRFFNSQIGSFLPLNFERLNKILNEHNREVHAMGVFGVLFIARMLRKGMMPINVTVGIYHQNEFMFLGSEHYFSNEAKRVFSNLDPRCLIFFNEASRDSYANFFRRDYTRSNLLPIGVSLSSIDIGISALSCSNRIVSIGNLNIFKTYNRHVINCMPNLLSSNPNLVYEIYGDGECRDDLKNLVRSLGLDDSVLFKGCIDYKDMPSVLNGSLLFVGSGTAIIEASALGIPSVIGIESSVEPLTYGLLSDVSGFTYHEMVSGRKFFYIQNVILELISDNVKWHQAAISCKNKAREFSIQFTVDGFLSTKSQGAITNDSVCTGYSNLLSLFSFLICSLKDRFGIDKSFSLRRDQGSIV